MQYKVHFCRRGLSVSKLKLPEPFFHCTSYAISFLFVFRIFSVLLFVSRCHQVVAYRNFYRLLVHRFDLDGVVQGNLIDFDCVSE